MRSIKQIIRDAGGPRAIYEAGPFKSVETVYKWSASGIPDRHWPILMKLAKATPDELFKANLAARREGVPQ